MFVICFQFLSKKRHGRSSSLSSMMSHLKYCVLGYVSFLLCRVPSSNDFHFLFSTSSKCCFCFSFIWSCFSCIHFNESKQCDTRDDDFDENVKHFEFDYKMRSPTSAEQYSVSHSFYCLDMEFSDSSTTFRFNQFTIEEFLCSKYRYLWESKFDRVVRFFLLLRYIHAYRMCNDGNNGSVEI